MTPWHIVQRWVSEATIPSGARGSTAISFLEGGSWLQNEVSSVCPCDPPCALTFSRAVTHTGSLVLVYLPLFPPLANGEQQQGTGKRVTVRSGISASGSHPPHLQWTP